MKMAYLAALLVLVCLMGGCHDIAMHGNALINGVDCRPEAMRNGQCAIRGAHK